MGQSCEFQSVFTSNFWQKNIIDSLHSTQCMQDVTTVKLELAKRHGISFGKLCWCCCYYSANIETAFSVLMIIVANMCAFCFPSLQLLLLLLPCCTVTKQEPPQKNLHLFQFAQQQNVRNETVSLEAVNFCWLVGWLFGCLFVVLLQNAISYMLSLSTYSFERINKQTFLKWKKIHMNPNWKSKSCLWIYFFSWLQTCENWNKGFKLCCLSFSYLPPCPSTWHSKSSTPVIQHAHTKLERFVFCAFLSISNYSPDKNNLQQPKSKWEHIIFMGI